GAEKLGSRARPLSASCDCRARFVAGRIRSQPGASGYERRRAEHEDSGHPEAGGSREIAELGRDSAAGADWRRSGGAAGGAGASAAGGGDAGVHDFKHEHRVGAGEYLSGAAGRREDGRRGGRNDGRISGYFSRENFFYFTSARSHHANSASEN